MFILKKIILLYACLTVTFLSKSQVNYTFVNIREQLVNNEVTTIIQDKKGFVWFGTRGGLQRFDGYEMKLLKYDFGKNTNLLSQSIEVLHNGKINNLWIGTKSGGLSEFNLETGKIKNYPNNKYASSFNADYILSILDTDSEKLFVGTWRGYQYLNKKTDSFTVLNSNLKTFDIQSDDAGGYWLGTDDGLRHLNCSLQNDFTINFGIKGINITSIVKDKAENCLWLGTWDKGLYKYNLATKTYKNYKQETNNPYSISSNNTYRIFLDSKGNLWIGTWGGGLNILNRTTEQFEKVDLNIPGLYSKDNQIILTIQEDPSGLLWIGTDGTGVYKFDLKQKKFKNIGYNSANNALTTSNHIYAVYVDPYKKLWLGTKGGNFQYSSDYKKFKDVDITEVDKNYISKSPYETRAFLQVNDYLWIGTIKGMMRIKNVGSKPGIVETFYENSEAGKYLKNKKIHTILRDSYGKIWIGTQEHGVACITGFNHQNQPIFKTYPPSINTKGALQNERAICILEDSKKRLWIGTYKGLHLYNPTKDEFEVFLQNNEPQHSITNNTIHSLGEDKFGNIWAASQSGLNMIYDYKNGKIFVKAFTTKNGLPGNYVNAVLGDKKGLVWASTNKGIVCLNPKTNQVTVFDKREGLLSNTFVEDAQFKDSNGYFYFGGTEGLTYFHPDSIAISKFSPPIYFTNLNINNIPYEFGRLQNDSSILVKPFYQTKELTLDHTENIFSIEFAALDFHSPDKNEYMYILEGFNKNWVNAGSNRLVTFTNLKHGTYTLKVKATNSDKLWSNVPIELKIKILPPPWKTWWAYTIYILAFLFLLWLTRYIGLRQVALENQLQFSNLARKKEQELSDFKERLFTNLSHEFRTPLTLILGPLDDLLQRKNLEYSSVRSLRLVQKQSKRMLRMVNQLLDFQKAEAGSIQLTPQQGEIVSFCKDVFNLFEDEAARRNINYQFIAKEKFISFTFDFNKLEIIVFNILSNAFKFTPNNGSIVLNVSKNEQQQCIITIQDSGMGIPPNELELIFDRFYRGKETNATNISGTGIGLSFVKELIELHEGKITAESDGKKGSLFTIKLPPLSKSNIGLVIQGNALAPIDQTAETIVNMNNMLEENESTTPELPIILLVEDESDMLQYIYETLAPSYTVITATNGREGIEKAMESIPDLIVSDVMMPEMDGIELCRKLKAEKNTSHIPIILLTALSDMQHHVEGIREGADVYLPKPFNSQLLLVHIRNLINSRNLLKDLYAKKVFLGTSNFEIDSYEEEFLYKLMKVVEENISNFNFNNDELANYMFMSKSTFYRKLKAITGMSGNEFIRTARLNHAAKLLESGKYSVSEVAFESGFNDIKYFRKRFQEKFNVTPSEYKK